MLSGLFFLVSARFAVGARIILMPVLCTARISFSSPPMSEIFPVMAMSRLISIFVNSETNAESSAMPMLGLPLLMLPSGMWTWTCMSRTFRIIIERSSITPSTCACALVQLSAICVLRRTGTQTEVSISLRCTYHIKVIRLTHLY